MPDCTTNTTSTALVTAFFALLFIVFLPVFLRNSYLLTMRVWFAQTKMVELKKMFLHEVGVVTFLSQSVLFLILLGCIFALAGIANPQLAELRPDGARVAYMFRERNYCLELAVTFDLAASILISGTCKIIELDYTPSNEETNYTSNQTHRVSIGNQCKNYEKSELLESPLVIVLGIPFVLNYRSHIHG